MNIRNHKSLQQRVANQVNRIHKADKDRPTLLAQTVYLGRWLDGFVEGYSMRWTLSPIIVGSDQRLSLYQGIEHVWRRSGRFGSSRKLNTNVMPYRGVSPESTFFHNSCVFRHGYDPPQAR